jgi:hypothetical protein
MTDQRLHRQVVAIDRELHRQMRVSLPITDWSVAAGVNALFVAAVEFGDTCREFPVVFVRVGTAADGKGEIAPVAVFGVTRDRNLYVEGGRWRATYIPAILRTYPFCIGMLDGDRYAVCIDRSWSGVTEEPQASGEALFTAEGQPSALLAEAQQQLERLENEVTRTRALCSQLDALGLFREMRFDASTPDGRTHSVDGFLTVDEESVSKLPDATVLDLHRKGLFALIHAHWLSLGHMRKLMDWHLQSAG